MVLVLNESFWYIHFSLYKPWIKVGSDYIFSNETDNYFQHVLHINYLHDFSTRVFVSLMYIITNLCMQVNGELTKIYARKLANNKYFIVFRTLISKFMF